MSDDDEAALADLEARLPDGWVASPPTYDKRDGLWVVRAEFVKDPPPYRPWREAFGATATSAIRALARQFKGKDVG
jgi:hypothetical protein